MGLRGAGKTTLGREAATRLGVAFVDLDDRTRSRLGAPTIREAWSKVGEPGFRAAEAEALRDALAEQPGVIALGGGAPTAPGAQALLREADTRGAVLVYLRAPPPVLRQRLSAAGTGDRPSLTGSDPIAEVDAVFRARDALYAGLARVILEVGRMERGAVVDSLVKAGAGYSR